MSHIQHFSCRDTAMDAPDSEGTHADEYVDKYGRSSESGRSDRRTDLGGDHERRRMQQLIAYDMLLCAFPRQQPPARCRVCEDNPVYTLTKAKADIDLVAKHATDMADHLIALGGTLDAKLEGLKADILSAIDAKFADLARTIHGEGEVAETTAIADLGARVSSLHTPTISPEPHEGQGNGEHQDHPPSDHHEAHGDHSHGDHGNGHQQNY